MEAQFTCQRCQTQLSIPAAELGKRVVCPACQASFVVTGSQLVEAPSSHFAPRGRAAGEGRPATATSYDLADMQTPPRSAGCAPLLAFGGIFAAIISLIVAVNLHRIANREWVEFREPGFRIEFPRQPLKEPVLDLPEGQVMMASLRYRKHTFLVAYLDLRKDARKEPSDKWLDWAQENMVLKHAKEGRITRAEDIKLEQHPGRELFVQAVPAAMRSRIFYVDGRIYEVSVAGVAAAGDRHVERFFGSFRLDK